MNPRLLRPLATGFNPKSIAGLNLWIDFADTATVTLDGSNKIQEVLDKSGLGQHGTQATSANRLGVSTLNGRQCADNGTSSNSFCVTYATGATNSNWRDTFVVAQWDAGGSTFPAFCSPFSTSASGGTNNGSMLVGNNGTANWNGGSVMVGTGRAWQTNGGPVLTGLATEDFNAFSYFGSAFIFRGNAQADVGVDGWQIGSDRALAGRGWRGRIGEVLSFSRSLTTAESKRVEGYLAWKWGLQAQLPSNHPYAYSFPGFGSQPRPSNADALDWESAVYANSGSVSVGTLSAVNTFANAIDAAGIRDRFFRMGIFAGDNLNAALVPLYRGQSRTGTQYGNTTDTNVNFVSGDYSEAVGLNANGTVGSSGKYLDTGLAPDDLPDSATGHCGVFADPLTHNNAANQVPIGCRSATSLFRLRVRFDGTLDGAWATGTTAVSTAANTSNALYLASRTTQTRLDLYIGTSSVANSTSNQTAGGTTNDWIVFNERAADGTVGASSQGFPGIVSAYSIGAAMSGADVTAFHTALTTFLAALGRPTT